MRWTYCWVASDASPPFTKTNGPPNNRATLLLRVRNSTARGPIRTLGSVMRSHCPHECDRPTAVSPRHRLHQSSKPNGPPTDPRLLSRVRNSAARGPIRTLDSVLRSHCPQECDRHTVVSPRTRPHHFQKPTEFSTELRLSSRTSVACPRITTINTTSNTYVPPVAHDVDGRALCSRQTAQHLRRPFVSNARARTKVLLRKRGLFSLEKTIIQRATTTCVRRARESTRKRASEKGRTPRPNARSGLAGAPALLDVLRVARHRETAQVLSRARQPHSESRRTHLGRAVAKRMSYRKPTLTAVVLARSVHATPRVRTAAANRLLASET